MTNGRRGKIFLSRTARNGCAAWQTPAPDSTPPCSNRRARDCTAGASEMSADKLPAADAAAFGPKQNEVRSAERGRKAGAAPKNQGRFVSETESCQPTASNNCMA